MISQYARYHDKTFEEVEIFGDFEDGLSAINHRILSYLKKFSRVF